MFETLTERLGGIFEKLRGRGALSEGDVDAALREIRIALLEADVALPVVKSFLQTVREKAVGQEVLKSITPGQMVVKIVHDHLVTLLSHPDGTALNLSAPSPLVILMVGLQGSGKTTTTAKLAKFLTQKEKKKVLMTSLDIYRPAAQEQLSILGQAIGVEALPPSPAPPLEIAKQALQEAKKGGFDVLLVDTAGRLHIDEKLMRELQELEALLHPQETLLVADALMGRDAITMAQSFHEQLKITGFVLSRVDGDSRGGAALSIRFVTGKPLKFLGTGEKPEQLEAFDPQRVAGRILGMGDVVGFVEKVAENLEAEELQEAAIQMQKGVFTLSDMARSLQQMRKMGGMGGLLQMLPGTGALKGKLENGVEQKAEKMMARQLAMISSMTPQERVRPNLLNGPRKRRIAQGSGTTVPEVNRLLKQYEQMSTLMKRMKKMGQKGFMRQGIQSLLGR
ncbi:MAG: signal recognition particle protein [Holosporales bacterium]